jgi:hypothetical protein
MENCSCGFLLYPTKNDEQQVLTFEEIHQVGAKRHTHQWIEANRAAISAMFAEGVSPTDMRMKRLVSMVVLRVLDATSAPAL